jgi:pyruvate/2-oxoglutarate dehydrogenase complex dihydrolipoamide acyltransferase (E2) component
MRREAILLPELGTGPDEPIVISHWFASRGARVQEGDRLVEVLVGPASFDVPSPRTGRLAEILGREDDRVRPGAVLAYLVIADESAPGRTRPETGRPDP